MNRPLFGIGAVVLLCACGDPTTVPFVGEDGPIPVAITAGSEHTCALDSEAVAWCWGRNASGQLGVGGTDHGPSPAVIAGGHSFALLDGGFEHTCGIDTSGNAWCWGDNSFGQLGDGSTSSRDVPTRVSGLPAVIGISSGALHTCARTEAGALYCWGENRSGQLGDGSTDDQTEPVRVPNFVATSVDAGLRTTCAGDTDGLIHCWGDNEDGLIHGSADSVHLEPTPLPLVPLAVEVEVGQNHACAAGLDNRTYCWGSNAAGQHGQGTVDPVSSVSPVIGFLPFGLIESSARSRHTCGAAQGTFYCWGANEDAQIRVGDDIIPRPVPIRILGIFVDAATGRVHSCTLEQSGGIICWGENRWGQLGFGPANFGQSGFGPRRVELPR